MPNDAKKVENDEAVEELTKGVKDIKVNNKKELNSTKETKEEEKTDEAEATKEEEKKSEEEKEEESSSSDEEEEAIVSVTAKASRKQDNDNEDGAYLAKGRDRPNRSRPSAASGPYSLPQGQQQQHNQQKPQYQQQQQANEECNVLGPFLDDIYPDLNMPQLDMQLGGGIPGLPELSSTGVNSLLMSSLDDVFFSPDANSGSRIIVPNSTEQSGYSLLPTPLSFVIDEYQLKMGINIPQMPLPGGAITDKVATEEKIKINVQLDPQVSHMITVEANIEQQTQPSTYWVLKSQFLRLQPFSGRSGLEAILRGVTMKDIEDARTIVANKSIQDLLKIYQDDFTLLMRVICLEDTPMTRAQIVLVTKKLLASNDPRVRKNVTENKTTVGSALDLAATLNLADIALFLSEVFYDLGEDLNCGHDTMMMLARVGDKAAQTMQCLLGLRFHGNGKVYSTSVRSRSGLMPIHVAAKSGKCPTKTIHLLSQDLPSCFSAATNDGSLPIHFACQFTKDPTLIATLLYYNRGVINVARKDGLTPLLLAAVRGDRDEPKIEIISLEEELQIRMISMLLEHGADKTASVDNGKTAQWFVQTRENNIGRPRVERLLKPSRKERSRQNSPTSGSPTVGNLSRGVNDLGLDDGEHHPQMSVVNHFDNMTSPEAFSGYSSDMSPHNTLSGSPPGTANNVYMGGSTGVGGGVESSSDESQEGNQVTGNQDLDNLIQLLGSHPLVQQAINEPL